MSTVEFGPWQPTKESTARGGLIAQERRRKGQPSYSSSAWTPQPQPKPPHTHQWLSYTSLQTGRAVIEQCATCHDVRMPD